MIEKSDHPNSIEDHPDAAAGCLAAARGVLADVAQHSAREAQAAGRTVLELGDDAQERRDAQGLLTFLTRGRETSR